MKAPLGPQASRGAAVLRQLVLAGTVLGISSALASVSAGSTGRRVVDFDWHEAFPATPTGRELPDLSLTGSVGGARLGVGWSEPRDLGLGEDVVVAARRRSRIRLEWDAPLPRTVELRCAAAVSRSGTLRSMVRLNGARVGLLRAGAMLESHGFVLPVESQRSGENVLELVNPELRAHPRGGEPVDGDDAIACSSVRIRESAPSAVPGRPPIHVTGGAIVLAPGAVLRAYARVGEIAPQFEMVAHGASTLVVTDEGGHSRSIRWVGDGQAERASLAEFAGRIVELRLAAGPHQQVRFEQGRLDSVSAGLRGRSAQAKAPPRSGRSGREREEAAHWYGDAAAPPHAGASRERPPPLLLLVIVDTLRADHLGLYGHERNTSPQIDRLGEESLVFLNAVAQSSWTTPATGSILTGLTPRSHGAERLSERMYEGIPALAHELQAAGWRTGGFVTNTNARGALGFERGFDEHRLLAEDPATEGVHAPFDRVVEEALAWLDDGDGRPTLLYLHPSDPHGPYAPPAACRDRFARADVDPELRASRDPARLLREKIEFDTQAGRAFLRARYDEEIACLDEAFGRLRRALEERGLFEDAIVVLTSDHGEEFHERGHLGHGRTLFGEQLDVPLILRLPGYPAGRRHELARQIDIAPTVLDALGFEPVAAMEGRSLLRPGQGGEGDVAVSRTFLGGSDVRARTTPTHRWLRTRTQSGIGYTAFDLRTDPREQHSVAGENPVRLGWIRQMFAAERLSGPRVGAQDRNVELDAATRARLESMGYLTLEER